MEKQTDAGSTPKTKPQIRGTDPNAIANRLEALYDNLHASSPRAVKINPLNKKNTQWCLSNEVVEAPGLDVNNNDCSPFEPVVQEQEEQMQEEQQQKIKYELPQDYQGTKNCSCFRQPRAYECGYCHHYFQGRLSEPCEKHPSESFLMDFSQCPYCRAQIGMIKEATLSWEDIRKVEEADLPSDTDL